MFGALARGAEDVAERTQEFYEEYFAVLDIAAEFYLDTARVIFTEHLLATRQMRWRARSIRPRSGLHSSRSRQRTTRYARPDRPRRRTISASTFRSPRRRHHLQAGAGHYGVFSGSHFEQEIYPVIKAFIGERDRPALAGVHSLTGPS
jgi:poly(3-hydroxybutyrate) depolymerase